MDKTINLSKGKTICLTKTAVETGESLKTVKVGLAWGQIEVTEEKFVKGTKPGFFGKLFGQTETPDRVETVVVDSQEVDLDASVCIYGPGKNLIETVCFSNKKSKDGAITHLGDDTTGRNKKGEGNDNETIVIDLHLVGPDTKYLVVILNSYRHDKFDQLPWASMRIYDGSRKFADYQIANNPEFVGKEALVLGVFERTGTGNLWKFKASGVATTERSIQAIERGSARKALD